MRHRIVAPGCEWLLPFAETRIKVLMGLGNAYADQSFYVNGCTVRVKITPGHEYIKIDGGEYELYVMLQLDVNRAGDNPSPTLVHNRVRKLTRIYKLNKRDPLNAKKAKLVYGGGSDIWVDESASTALTPDLQNSYLGTWISHTYETVCTGETKGCLSYASAIDGSLVTTSTKVESYSNMTYGEAGIPMDNRRFGSYWNTVTSVISYKGFSVTIADREDNTETFNVTVDERSRTYTGLRLYVWPYIISTTPNADTTKKPWVDIRINAKKANFDWTGQTHEFYPTYAADYVVAKNAANATYTQYKWTPGVTGAFEVSPIAYVASPVPISATDYTYEQIGHREKGFDYFRWDYTGAVDRKGNTVAPLPYRIILGDMLSKDYYIGRDTDNTLSVRRVTDDQKYGTPMVLAQLPGLVSRHEYSLALSTASAINYTAGTSDLFQIPRYFYKEDYHTTDPQVTRTQLYVSFFGDDLYQMDPLKAWSPMSAPVPPP